MRAAKKSEIQIGRGRHLRQRGSAILISMVMLVLMGVLAMSSLDTVMRDRQVAGLQNRSRSALYAAEAGIASAKAMLRSAPPKASGGIPALTSYDPGFPDGSSEDEKQSVGSGSLAVEFYADTGHEGIEYLTAGAKCWNGNLKGAMSENVGGKTPIWRDALFDVRVRGETGDGTHKVVQVTLSSCHPYDS